MPTKVTAPSLSLGDLLTKGSIAIPKRVQIGSMRLEDLRGRKGASVCSADASADPAVRLDSLQMLLRARAYLNRDTLVLAVISAYKDLESHRGFVSC